jgi:hypothetical protein
VAQQKHRAVVSGFLLDGGAEWVGFGGRGGFHTQTVEASLAGNRNSTPWAPPVLRN